MNLLAPGMLADQLAPALGREHLRLSVPLAPYTTFRIGGPADVLYDATSADALATAIAVARTTGIPWFVLGLGANILVGDRGFRGLVIRNVARHVEFREDGEVMAESGTVVSELIAATVDRGLSGLEHFVGIPSTVGGAVWQNLHFLSPAPARERTMFIAEVVREVELVDPVGVRRQVDRDGMRFGYDVSLLHQPGHVALAVTFQLQPGQATALRRVMEENLAWRASRHPRLDVSPSAGSVFKKIEGVGAGRLIEQCGLKGFSIGGAQISPLHANILVNAGGASATDVRALIAHAQHAVLAKFGQHLEPEIGFIGEF
ncbi:MAG: UDP-N-acetylmuramate dehydrogenase [Gemmatimonadaceae bacterium]